MILEEVRGAEDGGKKAPGDRAERRSTFFAHSSLCCEVENHFFGQLHAPHVATSVGRTGGSLLFSSVEHEVRVCGNVHFY